VLGRQRPHRVSTENRNAGATREDWNFLDPDVLAWRLAAAPIDRYVKDLFELLRRVIEPAAASLAALRATATRSSGSEDAYRSLEAAGDDGESLG